MIIENDSFPEYPTAVPGRDAAPASTIPPADSAQPDQASDTQAPDAAQSVESSPPASETLIIPEQIQELSPEISDDVAEKIEEVADGKKKSPDDAIEKNISNLVRIHAEDTPNTIGKITSTIEIRIAALRARMEKRETKLQRIMESARNRGSISNDDIVRMLYISDKSATRYANLLVQRGELIRTGKGRGVRYVPRS